jgi:ribosomal protein L11 methyltransferase
VVPAAAEDAVTDLFSSVLSAPCASYHDLETGKSTVSAFIENVSVYNLAQKPMAMGIQWIRQCGLLTKTPRIHCAKLKREDWAESWKRHFKPLEVSDRLLVKPSWSRQKAKKGQSVVVLDPGLSFGTGNHPTTGYCLRELARAAQGKEPESFLDAGTGSGILAISGAKLGFSPIEAFDFDAEAVATAQRNARRNHVEKKIRFSKQDATRFRCGQSFTIICANLSTEVLERTMDRWSACLAPKGSLVLAGILKTEFDAVVERAKTNGLSLIKRKNEKEWCSGTFRKAQSGSYKSRAKK